MNKLMVVGLALVGSVQSAKIQSKWITVPDFEEDKQLNQVVSEINTSAKNFETVSSLTRETSQNQSQLFIQTKIEDAKDKIIKKADSMLLQISKPVDPNNLDFDKVEDMMKEIEQVYNYERDMATARVQNTKFDDTVGKINTYMKEYRKTFKDNTYLRDPLPPMESAMRRKEDK